jgi:hypothetical protein
MLPSSDVTHPWFFQENPLPHIRWAVPEFDPLCFTNRQEMHSVKVNQSNVFKIENEFLFAAIDLCLQLPAPAAIQCDRLALEECSGHPKLSQF